MLQQGAANNELDEQTTERQCEKQNRFFRGWMRGDWLLCTELLGKDSDAGRDWGQEEKGMTEDEMAGWHH